MEINESIDNEKKRNVFKIEEMVAAEEANSKVDMEDDSSDDTCLYNIKYQKHIKLQNVIRNLSDVQGDEESLKREILKLNDIYTGEFRHRYSMILNTVQSLTNSQRDLLVVNLQEIDNLIRSQQISLEMSAMDGFEKFYDHIQLDVSRINDLEKRFGQQKCVLEGSVDEAKKIC